MQRARKFSEVLGVVANKSIMILPAAWPPIETSKNTVGYLGAGAAAAAPNLLKSVKVNIYNKKEIINLIIIIPLIII